MSEFVLSVLGLDKGEFVCFALVACWFSHKSWLIRSSLLSTVYCFGEFVSHTDYSYLGSGISLFDKRLLSFCISGISE